MKKGLLLLIIMFVVSNAFSLTIELINGTKITGKLNGRKKNELYFTNDDDIYIISINLIQNILEDSQDVTDEIINTTKPIKINWVSYLNIFEFNNIIDIDDFNKRLKDDKNALYGIGIDYFNKSLKGDKTLYTYPNIELLPISIISFALMWDYICQIKDINDAIKGSDEVGLNLNNLKKDKTRKAICCVAFGFVGLGNTIYSLKKIEVKASPNSILLSYKF